MSSSERDTAVEVGFILDAVAAEVARAQAKFQPYHSAHEGASVIREEFEELWDEIKNNKQYGSRQRQMLEAIQIAATAVRFIYDLGIAGDVVARKDSTHGN